MKKVITITLVVLSLLLVPLTYAYWDETEVSTININFAIQVGHWQNSDDTAWKDIIDNWNLNIWEDESTHNRFIPQDQIFSYNGNYYIVMPNASYNPAYHGFPEEGRSQWAHVSLDMFWKPNMNYRTNSVVTRNDKYYIANSNYNSNWFTGDPSVTGGTYAWAEWLEIEKPSPDIFDWLVVGHFRDYSKPDLTKVIYK